MTLREIIMNIGEQSEVTIIFAKKVDEGCSPSSEALLVKVPEEDHVHQQAK